MSLAERGKQDRDDEQDEDKQYRVHNAIQMMMNRLDKMENKMDMGYSEGHHATSSRKVSNYMGSLL